MRENKAQLHISADDSPTSCRISSCILLRDAAERLNLECVRHLLVEDSAGNLMGIVDSADVLKRLGSENETEQQRWGNTALEALVTVRLDTCPDAVELNRDPDGAAVLDATAVSSREQLVALDVGDDVMIRWSSVKGVLQRALFDPVTELPNRAVFDRHLEEEWERVQRRKSSIAVVMIDLDYFKNVNDVHGHSVGDMVLRTVAETLSSQLRSYDLLARYGGDEFAAILTDCYMTDIHIPASRLHAGIARLARAFDFDTPELSISIGAVTCPGSLKKTKTELVDAADECLYAAKHAGRNCSYTVDLALAGRNAKPQPLRSRPLPIGVPGPKVPRPTR